MKKSLALTAILLILPATASYAADGHTPRVDRREANQERRIEQGVGSGQLTAPEARRMNRMENRIEKSEEAAKSDGKVTARERARLHREQKRANKRIYRQKHDAQHN